MSQELPVPGPQPSSPPAVINRRASVRYQCAPATTARIVPADTQDHQHAWVLDFSREGVGLVVSRPIPVDQHVYLLVKGPAGQAFELGARVAHATRRPDGDWLLGCQLHNKLTDEDLEALLQ
jgi:hypothetical protein